MRSLVFLPPPTLSLFSAPSSSRTTLTSVSIPVSHTPHPRILADETRPIQQQEEEVPDSVDPHLPYAFAEEQEGAEEESVARSEILDAPLGVPWEVLHPDAIERSEHVQLGRAVSKRVRIKSPVLVIETPERGSTLRDRGGGRNRCGGLGDEVVPTDVDVETEADKSRVVIGDESEEDDQQDHGQDASYPEESRVSPTALVDETTNAMSLAPVDTKSPQQRSDAGNELSLLAGIPTSRAVATSLAAAAPTAPTEPMAWIPSAAAETPQDSTSQSASSLLIRAPVPAAASSAAAEAQTTCRFTFFSRNHRASRSSTSMLAETSLSSSHIHSPALAAAAERGSRHVDAVVRESYAAPPPLPAERMQPLLPARVDAHAFNASFNSLAFQHHLTQTNTQHQASDSIQPPPTLHFDLARITPVARILAHPAQFVSPSNIAARSMRAGAGAGLAEATVGGVSSKVNLLVVVKQVGEVQRVRDRFGVDSAALAPRTALRSGAALGSGRPEIRTGMSSAFRAAAAPISSHRPPGLPPRSARASPGEDGKTERVALTVMDGRMSAIRRLVVEDPQSATEREWSVVEEVEEKQWFQVVLWGKLAREWTGDEGSTEAMGHGSIDGAGGAGGGGTEESILGETCTAAMRVESTLTPTALRPGDVICLSNLDLARSTSDQHQHSTSNATLPTKKPFRLGTGFPSSSSSRIHLVAHASTRNSARIELCFRSHVESPHDAARNFDEQLAAFDLRSRRVWELVRLWRCSTGRRAAGH